MCVQVRGLSVFRHRSKYNWHRYYDPSLGRYISADPIGQAGGINVYAYAANNPANRIDPSGLINIIVGGVGGSAVAPTGGEASVGVFVNPGLGDSDADAGVFASAGAAGGLNVSADRFVGYIEGDANNVSGPTVNQNFGIGPVSISLFHDPETGDLVGGTIGIGPGALPFGYSVAYGTTGTLTLRGLLDALFGSGNPEACEEASQ